jgi:hypothetical protein
MRQPTTGLTRWPAVDAGSSSCDLERDVGARDTSCARVLRGHHARPQFPGIEIEAAARRLQQADFVMLRDAQIAFEGSAEDLRQSRDPYLREFLS